MTTRDRFFCVSALLLTTSVANAAVITGNIQVATVGTSTSPATVLGYLATTPNSFGEFVLTDPTGSANERLLVSFDPSTASTGGQLPGSLALTALNGPVGQSAFNSIGGIVGPQSSGNNLNRAESDISYATLGGTPNLGGPSIAVQRQTYGSSTAQPVQSNVWSWSGAQLQPVWLNSNGPSPAPPVAAPSVSIVYLDDRDGDPSNVDAEAFVLTADPEDFIDNSFGGQVVTFSVVEAVPEPGSASLIALGAATLLTRRRRDVCA